MEGIKVIMELHEGWKRQKIAFKYFEKEWNEFMIEY
jgi:hypothetical protein